MEHPKAAAYEKLYPETGIGESQKVERYERIELKQRKAETGKRSRYVSVPALPWHKEQ